MELLERLAANDLQLTKLVGVPRSVGMRELAIALVLNTTLTHLGLRDRGLVDADAHELAGALERNKSLKTLDMDTNNGPDGARYLAAALERNKTLKTLNLSFNNIGPDGARHLAAALGRNKVLREFWLDGNNVGDDGAAAFRTALERNNTLVE
jgi:Ran GTPase-activating protein (RanGAP) involved in mRNA processing and transport